MSTPFDVADWARLLRVARSIIRQVNSPVPVVQDWTFGGGTALMVRIGHRESRDVDIFLPDPQLLSFFDPGKRDFELEIHPDDYRGDGSRFLKMTFEGIGEIDFIAANALTSDPSTSERVQGEEIQLETVPEVIARRFIIEDQQ